jgi:hypothetical protein
MKNAKQVLFEGFELDGRYYIAASLGQFCHDYDYADRPTARDIVEVCGELSSILATKWLRKAQALAREAAEAEACIKAALSAQDMAHARLNEIEPTNKEGLTQREWLAAAVGSDEYTTTEYNNAWLAGEDPTEYRAHPNQED